MQKLATVRRNIRNSRVLPIKHYTVWEIFVFSLFDTYKLPTVIQMCFHVLFSFFNVMIYNNYTAGGAELSRR